MNVLADALRPAPTAGEDPTAVDPRHRRLFSALSREICRPLISLHAGLDLLLAGCEGTDATERDQLQSLRAQCGALIGLTRSFLDYAGPPAVGRNLGLIPFRLGALLAEADRQFSGPAAARGIGWSCRLDGPDAPVVTDLTAFQQVVGEIVTNAMAHTPAGGRIDVSGRAEEGAWSIEVADDGRGIPAQVLERAFEPLIRASASAEAPSPAAPAGGGHGMGLAVCREVVARLGGEIALHSLTGRGTTVRIRFQARPAQAGSGDI